MKFLSFYKDILKCQNEDEVFNYFITNLKPSVLLWNYFVDWQKVFKNIKEIEIALNSLNYLIGKENFDDEFKFLIKQNPEIVKVIPALVVRSNTTSLEFNILVDYQHKKLIYDFYDFDKDNPTEAEIEKYLVFIERTGLKDLIVSQKIKNLVDYMIGVEAGIGSHGRKNRGGHSMENVVECFIKDFCYRNKFKYLKEANAAKIKEQWGYEVPVDKSSRRYDFVINKGDGVIIVEVNFYGGGGSKLKSTAGEYKNLSEILKNNYKFIWITDGYGWKKTQKPLQEAFEQIEHIVSLDMLEKGILDHII